MHSVLQEDRTSNARRVFINIEGAGLRSVSYIGERTVHIAGAQYDAASNSYIQTYGGVRVLPGEPSLDMIEHYVLFGINEYLRGKADGREDFKSEVRAMFAGDD